MSPEKRPVLRLKADTLASPADDKVVELAVYDVLLPCRRFEIDYKVAVLGRVSPSLEFLLRLLRSVPGIEEEKAAAFFGFTPTECEYVLQEAIKPNYVEREDGRLWLTDEGEGLFSAGQESPSVYEVHNRHASLGFDLFSLAPQRPPRLELAEFHLPEFPVADGVAIGTASRQVGQRFKRFFYELGDHRDRDQYQRRDLYSVDSITAADRFHAPVRIKVQANASNPSIPEIDLSAWRPENEILDRPEVEHAAGRFVENLRITKNDTQDFFAYQALVDLAPDFLKEFVTQKGLAVNRYWKEAVSRAGEPRADRKTIALVGSLFTQGNAERLSAVFDYGVRDRQVVLDTLIWVSPQIKHWGATTQLRDTMTLLKTKVEAIAKPEEDARVTSHCLVLGRPARYIERMFDSVHQSDIPRFPPALEILVLPNTLVAVSVHAPVGASTGLPAPLGWASFDSGIVSKVQDYLLENLDVHIRDDETREAIRDRCSVGEANPPDPD